MRNSLKAASAVSLAMSAAAIMFTTDVTFASATEDTTHGAEIIVDSSAVEAAEAAREAEELAYGTGEVVQEIPEDALIADHLANEAAEESQQFVDSDAGSLSELVALQATDGALSPEMQCLAGTVYFESKGESLAGQLAVANVVLRRAESSRFPDSICGVVYQRKQFSFVRGGRMPSINKNSNAWHNAVAIAKIAKNSGWNCKADGALFFHARYVNPGWRLQRIATIDNHIFYR